MRKAGVRNKMAGVNFVVIASHQGWPSHYGDKLFNLPVLSSHRGHREFYFLKLSI
jgi:hypothetical protein